MFSFFAIIALAAGTLWLEAPGLIHRKLRKELIVFLVLLLAASGLYGAMILHVVLPNPLMILKYMYGWIGGR